MIFLKLSYLPICIHAQTLTHRRDRTSSVITTQHCKDFPPSEYRTCPQCDRYLRNLNVDCPPQLSDPYTSPSSFPISVTAVNIATSFETRRHDNFSNTNVWHWKISPVEPRSENQAFCSSTEWIRFDCIFRLCESQFQSQWRQSHLRVLSTYL